MKFCVTALFVASLAVNAQEFDLIIRHARVIDGAGNPWFRADVGIVETRPRSWTLAMQVQGPPDFNTGDEHPFSHLIADFSKLVFDAWGG